MQKFLPHGRHFTLPLKPDPSPASLPSGTRPCLVVLPVFNEAETLPTNFARVLAYAENHPDFQFCWADDGSGDGSGNLIEQLCREASHPRIRCRIFPFNHGKGRVIQQVFSENPGTDFFFLDGDLPYPLETLENLRLLLASADLAIGARSKPWRKSRSRISVTRIVLGQGFNTLTRFFLGLKHRDMQAGIKAFRSDAARRIFSNLRTPGFAFDAEVLYLAKKFGLRAAELPVEESESHLYERSKVRLFRHSLVMLACLVKIRWQDATGAYEKTRPAAEF